VVLTAAALLACGRTKLELLWDNTLGAALPSGGAFAADPGGAAGLAHGGIGGTLGIGGMNALPASAGNSLGGAVVMPQGGAVGVGASGGVGGADAGAGGSLPVLAACNPDATPILDGPLPIRIKSEPVASVAGDWNIDGKLDLATANRDGSVSVLFGRGDGSFASSITYPSSLERNLWPWSQASIAAGDLDGNGTLDLVLDQPLGVTVFLGAVDGSFAPAATYPLRSALAGLALGDFNRDGQTDVALGSNDSKAVVVMLGKGDGTLGGGIKIILDDWVKHIAAGDLNHDGRLDILALSEHETAVLLGDEQALFVKARPLEAQSYNGGMRLADFNADGDLDFVRSLGCGPPDGDASDIELWLGHGDGTFSEGRETNLFGICAGRLTVADVNRDGVPDVLPSPITVLFGQPGDRLAPLITNTRAGGGSLLGVGDWNGDGDPDLATASSDWVVVHLGNGDGSFGSSPVYATKSEPQALTLADLDADGALDVATTTAQFGRHGGWGSSALNVIRGAGDGTFLGRVDYDTTQPTRKPTAVDLDRDGSLDMLSLTHYSNLCLQYGNGDASFAPEALWLAGNEVESFAVGDLNGDERPDVVMAIRDTPQLELFFGNSAGNFTPGGSIDLSVPAAAVALVDSNGDAKQDIVVTLPRAESIEVMLGHGDGNFAAGSRFPAGGGRGSVIAADLNADSKADLVAWNSYALSVLLGAGDGSFTKRFDFEGPISELAAADFNQDRHQDLIMVHDGGITLLFGAGDGTFTCMTRYPSAPMRGIGVGDLNHDRRTDLVTTTREGINVFLNTAP
jgi:hypothetical protein